MLTYKNTSENDQVLIGIGVVEAGQTVEVSEPINNTNFEIVNEEEARIEQPSVVGIEHEQPEAVTEVHPAETNTIQGAE